jgi:hypothetical protein
MTQVLANPKRQAEIRQQRDTLLARIANPVDEADKRDAVDGLRHLQDNVCDHPHAKNLVCPDCNTPVTF